VALVALAFECSNRFANASPDPYHYGFAVCDLATVVLIGAALARDGGPVAGLLGTRPLVWIGGISYGIYLWHLPIFDVADQRFGTVQYRFLIPAEFAAAIGAAWLSYRFVERPVLRLKRRFTPRRA
jgi:peptidoglycan/LPS O-acetylase OafA/YrhL